MTYFEARRIERLFMRYRQLTVDYWKAVEPIERGRHGWMAGPGAPRHNETDASRPLRQTITMLEPEVEHWAQRLGVGVSGVSYPAPAVGGPALPFNFLSCVTDQWIGYTYVSQDNVLDAIDKCIGAAQFVKRRIAARLLKPWCWLVDVPALLVGWPFEVLRKAGVPEKFVEGTGAQVVKAILTALLWLAAFAYAIYRTDLPAAIQKTLEKTFG